MELRLPRRTVRSWRLDDVGSMALHANNRKIWLNLRDAFPHPYAEEDATRFISGLLEKAGYACEARLRRSAIKEGKVIDPMRYAFVPET